MKEKNIILPVLIGPPGVGKTTLAEIVHGLSHGIRVVDGDIFISEEGNKKLQDGTWNDTDRLGYLTNMAQGVASELAEKKKVMLIDAMTTNWMRHYFLHKLGELSDEIDVRWVHVSRQFHPHEIEALIEERARENHPINSVEVFKRFSNRFEPLVPPFETLENPGSQYPRNVFQQRIEGLIERLYGSKE